ncbi:protein FAM83A [Gastrophryne carolinensis]
MNRCKALGKIKKRLQDAKNKWARLGKAEFSYNESARFATDALLEGGQESYQKVLEEEGEVNFLSKSEVQYILDNVKEPYYAKENHSESENGPEKNGNSRLSECFYPVHSDIKEPALLHNNWSTEEKPYLKDKSSATVYFQSDKPNHIRETIRRSIHRATQVIAIMMDEFTDVEIFCDILEAANKRNVVVYLLLEATKLHGFLEMCDKLEIKEAHLKNISVKSVTGEVYCAKSGRKFFGQIHEKFVILDWRTVISGTYSFTWLSGQVHRNYLCKFSGQVVELFDEEFRLLYGISKSVMGLKSPAPMASCLRRESVLSTVTSSSHESINTTSEPLSCSSVGSVSHESQRAPSPTSVAIVSHESHRASSPTSVASVSHESHQASSPTSVASVSKESQQASSPTPPTSPTSVVSISHESQRPSPPTSPISPISPSPSTSTISITYRTPTQSPLQRMNTFTGYPSIRTPQTPTNYQSNYYQRNPLPETPTHLFNRNNNIYRSLRTRRDDLMNSRFTQGWRFFAKPTLTYS